MIDTSKSIRKVTYEGVEIPLAGGGDCNLVERTINNMDLSSGQFEILPMYAEPYNEDLDLSTIEVDKGEATYGFVYDSSTGRLEPTNKGQTSSFAYGRINFDFPTDGNTITMTVYQSSEANYDYGFISKLDLPLGYDYDSNETNAIYNSRGLSGEYTHTFTDVPAGEHFITFKYIKDGSGNNGSDTFAIVKINVDGSKLVSADGMTKAIVVKSDKLVPENIRIGETVYGVEGTLVPVPEEAFTDGLARYVAGDDTLTQLTPNDFGNITELKAGAFFVNTSIKTPTVAKITLPSTVTKLGNNCFYGNTALQEINTENIDTMGTYCFSGCTGLKHIDISKVAEKGMLPQYLLNNCNGLENIITGKYGSNPYISPSTYSLYGLKNLKDVNNGENVLRVISANSGTSYQCAYISSNLEEPVIDMEDYSSRWATSGSGIKYTFAYSKFRSFTYVNAYEFKQGGAGYIKEGAFSGATVIDMYMPKVTNLGDNRAISGITLLKRLHIPVVTNILGNAIPAKCEKAIIGNTAPTLSSAMTYNTTTKFYVPYTKIEYYSGATNWSTLFLNDGTEETRFIVYGDFASGNTLPTLSSGGVFTIKWFVNEDCTTEVTTSLVESDGRYYGKVFAKTYADTEDVSDITYVAGNTTATSYSLSTTSEVNDTILAGVITRSDTTVSDGWELVVTAPAIDYSGTPQYLNLYKKIATTTNETITVSQSSNARIYIGLANIKNRDVQEIPELNSLVQLADGDSIKVQKTTNNPIIYFSGNYLSTTDNTQKMSCGGQYNDFDCEADVGDRLHYVLSAKESGTSFTITTNGETPYNSLAVELISKE